LGPELSVGLPGIRANNSLVLYLDLKILFLTKKIS
jgi:hypothetical protein